MSFKRLGLGLALILGCALILLWFQLNRIAETAIQARFGKVLKDQGIAFIIHDIGLFHTRMGQLRYGDVLLVENAEFSYRPGTMPAMESWRFSGLVIDAGTNGGKLVPLGASALDGVSGPVAGPRATPRLEPALIPRQVEIRNGLVRLTLDRPGAAPLPLTLPFNLKARIHPMDARAELGVDLTCLGQPLYLEADLDLAQGVRDIEFRAMGFDLKALALILPELSPYLGGKTDITAKYRPGKPLGINLSAIDLEAVQPGAGLSDIQVTLTPREGARDIHAQGQFTHPLIPGLPWQGRVHLDDPGTGLDRWQCELGLRSGQIPSLVIKNTNRLLALEHPRLNLTLAKDKTGLTGEMGFRAVVKRAVAPEGAVRGGKIRCDFKMIGLPAARQGMEGRILITGLGMEKPIKLRPMGADLDLKWRPGKGLDIGGRLMPDQLDLPPVEMTGRATLKGGVAGQLSFSLPRFPVTSQTLRPFMDLPEDLSVTAQVTVGVEVTLSQNGLGVEGNAELEQGQVQWPDMGIFARGIHTRLSLEDLFTLRSHPGQILSIEALDMGRLTASHARVRYSLESGGLPLVENLLFSWCRGRVSSEAFRLPSGSKALDLTLYCDRLFLSDILHQIGGFTAEGEGTVSGRIPIRYQSGRMDFNNGFLFSTPGKGGRVKVMDTENITRELPMDSPQFAQLDLTREALKDFSYKWARLNLNTREEQLVAALQMDGRPNGLLPFVFQKEIGGFARVRGKAQGSRFQGITLNLNLKLPLNQVMKLGKGMNEVLTR